VNLLRVIAVANQKGGCGKTTTSINFSACLARLGKNILLIDLDPQGHATCGLGVKVEWGQKSVYELLSCRPSSLTHISESICSAGVRLNLIPSHETLNELEQELAGLPNRSLRLKEKIERLCNEGLQYDYLVLDCPPNLGILTSNAFAAADEVIIPIEPSFFSLHGLAKITETLCRVNRGRSQPLELFALLTLFRSDLSFSQEIYEEVKKYFGNKLLKTIIHENVVLKEAASAGRSIVDYAPDSSALRDYLNLATEYLRYQCDRNLPADELGWDRVFFMRYGPKPVAGGVLFQMLSQTAHCVEIAGDFNGWVPEPLVRRNDSGLWQKVVPVRTGGFRYKYIVDGEWQVDPHQPCQMTNAFGGFDSFLEIAQ
jgi:chromosome partitioning protein